jgi:alpha-glucoside transport system permease protein
MTTTTPDVPVGQPHVGNIDLNKAEKAHKMLTNRWASAAAVVIAVFWTIPTVGLLISSFRPQADVQGNGWWNFFVHPHVTLDNYRAVLRSSDVNLATYFVNSLVITIPAVIIPITIATMAAYAFAWMKFPGRDILFVAVFALPLAIYLLHNFMKEIPAELIEAARVDGAGHVRIFTRIMLPLMAPAIAAFAIFQFLWVWNDLLVALVFGGGSLEISPLTVRLAELSGTRGQDWHLLAAGAFVSLIVPLVVFLAGQRYFVRGLLSGSVKG